MDKKSLSPEIVESVQALRQALHDATTFGVIAATCEIENHDEAIQANAWNLMLEHLHQFENAFNAVSQSLGLEDAC